MRRLWPLLLLSAVSCGDPAEEGEPETDPNAAIDRACDPSQGWLWTVGAAGGVCGDTDGIELLITMMPELTVPGVVDSEDDGVECQVCEGEGACAGPVDCVVEVTEVDGERVRMDVVVSPGEVMEERFELDGLLCAPIGGFCP